MVAPRLANIDLPVPGGPIQHVVPSGGGDFQSPLDGFLSFDLGEIQFLVVRLGENPVDIHLGGGNWSFPCEKACCFAQVLDGNHR